MCIWRESASAQAVLDFDSTVPLLLYKRVARENDKTVCSRRTAPENHKRRRASSGLFATLSAQISFNRKIPFREVALPDANSFARSLFCSDLVLFLDLQERVRRRAAID
jgi:hypothetical protein